ncbi:MAG: ATP-binding protein [Paludibacter sp.]|nr:ATP-binding protein [Paludibacter sp.]
MDFKLMDITIIANMKFYNRTKELQSLRLTLEQSRKSACFTAVIGRRRVGKTTLLMESVQSNKYLYLFVSRKNEQMLCTQFQKDAKESIGLQVFGSITDFRTLFEQLLLFAINEPFTLIIDEFQEFDRVNKSIFSDIQDLWDRYSNKSKINFIACGSIYSMMKKIFENEKEPLFGRLNSKMVLRPFTINSLKEILKDYNNNCTSEDILCLYLITGGVPKYVALLMESGSITKDKMIAFAVRADSPFLSEGKDLLVSEFGKDYGVYFSILQLIASGKTSQSEIDSIIEKNTGSYLMNLETEYSLIKKNKPIFSKPESRNIRWSLNDNFLLFWFRFIYPNQSMIELGKNDRLYEYIQLNYEQFSGLILERYFRDKIAESEEVTQIGNYWDRKGGNEIDIVAVDSVKKTAIIAEVKRNKHKINLNALMEKKSILANDLSKYKIEYIGLSLDDV